MTRTSCFSVRGMAVALLIGLAPVGPAAAMTAEAGPVEASLAEIEAGDYVWRPELAGDGPVEIVVSLGAQRAYVYRGGTLIGASSISSGKKGHESPVGRFEILQKRREHYSNRYDNAPMPYMQRLNWYGIALHGGHVPDRPASHGCIRLPVKFAQKLFGATEVGGFVFVTEDVPESPQAALELARAHYNQPVPPDRTPEWTRGGS